MDVIKYVLGYMCGEDEKKFDAGREQNFRWSDFALDSIKVSVIQNKIYK